MPPPPESPPPGGGRGRRTVLRFDFAERWSHRSFAALMGVAIVTAACLYLPELSQIVGQRTTLRLVHIISGFLLPVPLIIGYATSRRFRRDVTRLNRFSRADMQWLKAHKRLKVRSRDLSQPGKFNAGQKLNSAFTLGALLVMLATGAMLTFASYFADSLRTGAIFVHDWLALAVVVVAVGHMWKAAGDAEARLGMRDGFVSPDWVSRHHPGWGDEIARKDR